MIFKAIKFAVEAHEGQYRKGTDIPYITHLINVMQLLYDYDCSEQIIIAGILHDTIEDTNVTFDDIKINFGEKIAKIVSGVSEIKFNGNNKIPWKQRKQHTIDYLKNDASIEELIVACADKTDNLLSIKKDYLKIGESIWQRFNAGKIEQKWYYETLSDVFAQRAKDGDSKLEALTVHYKQLCKEVFS